MFGAGCFALYGVMGMGSLSSAVGIFIFAAVVGTFPMCGVALLFLPLVWSLSRMPHPAVFSLLGMMTFGAIVIVGDNLIGISAPDDVKWMGAKIALFSMLYAAPIGFFLRRNLHRVNFMTSH